MTSNISVLKGELDGKIVVVHFFFLSGICPNLQRALTQKITYNFFLRFLSTLWPILQVIAHHIQDKLAVSFDSSSIGLISFKWFLTIYAKYSSVKTYNEEDSIF